MADLMEDQEPVMKGPQFNSIVALNKLSHEEFITRAMTIFADISIDIFSQTF
jgi:hypothetical protein